jgi:hypothetical protein
MKVTKSIEIVDMIEKLYKLDSDLSKLPPIIGERVVFNVIIDSIGDLISLADQYDCHFFEPTNLIPCHWVLIEVGDRVRLSIETPRENYKITY